jgi:hypothetical protein
VQPWCSLKTSPAPPPLGDPEVVRRQSRERYGRTLAEVDAALLELRGGEAARDLGARRRAGGPR